MEAGAWFWEGALMGRVGPWLNLAAAWAAIAARAAGGGILICL